MRKIPITIRKAGKKFTSLSGTELIEKVTKRAIEKFLSGVLEISTANYNASEVEYQPVFHRGQKGERSLKCIRVRRSSDERFIEISQHQIQKIGVTDNQILEYFKKRSVSVKPILGSLSTCTLTFLNI